VYEFVAPPLDSIAELRQLVEQKIEKMNQVAMIRSDELIKASRSGVQIEMYDSKLEAFIRKKATSLENVEAHSLWPMWFDWQGLPVPQDLTVSYNRLYSNRGLQQEIAEVTSIMNLVSEYETRFAKPEMEELETVEMESEELPNIPGRTYPDGEAIPATLPELYQSASNSAVPAGQNCANCEYYQNGACSKFAAPVRENYWCAKWEDAEMEMEDSDYTEEPEQEDSDEEFLDEMKEKIKARMKQLIDSSFSENSL
jgi:hypothetical protein